MKHSSNGEFISAQFTSISKQLAVEGAKHGAFILLVAMFIDYGQLFPVFLLSFFPNIFFMKPNL